MKKGAIENVYLSSEVRQRKAAPATIFMTQQKPLDLFWVKIEVLVAGSAEKLVSLLENREKRAP